LRIRAIQANTLSPVARAARLIYLNRTCFNGLYRVNSKTGQFNVPFGDYKNPVICDEPNLLAASKILTDVELLDADFEVVLKNATEGDVVYLDPPYLPISTTSKFTAYNTNGFSVEDHKRLAACFARLTNAGICCVLSNSYAPLTMELYGKYNVTEHMGARVVGGPSAYRKPVKEIIVSSQRMIARK
jgi:DNA adenine methylase